MIDWLKEAYNDLIEWFKAILQAIFDFFTDLGILILDSFLSAILSIFESIPVPDFLSGGLNGLFGFLPSGVLYFLDMSGVPESLAILGVGFTFRMSRKLFTLGRW